jgi:hypothetical protein
LLALGLLLGASPPAAAVEQVPPGQAIVHRANLDVDVWVNKDEGGVYRPGESMRVYFRASSDAYVLLYNIDTEGYIHLIYPYGPADPPLVPGGKTCVVPSRSDPYELAADGPPGVEYVVALASPVPFRNLPWYLADTDRGRPPEGEYGGEDADEGYIVGDPYVGMEQLNRRIVPPGHENEVASSDTYFYIDRRVEYPRYVCADCHYHTPYFDPYGSVCSIVDIRVDATWIHYAPVRWGAIRPRYYYVVRSTAPTRYRQWKNQWSSKDGTQQLRERFVVSHDLRGRREGWLKDRPRTREYFDLRRVRQGRVWQGRDEVLRLRERRQQVDRERNQGRDEGLRRGWGRNRVDRPGSDQPRNPRELRERRPPARGQPPSDDRAQRRRDPPPDRDRGGSRGEERVRERQDRQPDRQQEKRQDRSDQKEQRKEEQSKGRGRGR